jgi:hypothetical protein
MKYIYFSDGTDNGKPFNSLEEAIDVGNVINTQIS